MKLWGGRFSKETDTLANDFQSSIHFKEIDSQQRKPHNHQITRNQQNDRYRTAHQRRLLG